MAQRNLLLCFDAFGTLFHPRAPVLEQYITVAQQFGLGGFSIEDAEASFKTAFSRESKLHPNYGKASGMGASKWWTNVIHQTFQPLVRNGTELPKDLAPTLYRRFSSGEGYSLSSGVTSLLRSLKQKELEQRQRQRGQHFKSPRIVIGVITNSDDRVPNILSSLGLRVSPLRFGDPLGPVREPPAEQYDIDLHCMSYDVGFGKPDRRIFDAAEDLAVQLVATQEATEHEQHIGPAQTALPWLKLYVGDEYENDVLGARGAGWTPIFVGTEEVVSNQDRVLDLEQLGKSLTLEDLSQQHDPRLLIKARSTQHVLKWLIEQYESKQ
ncbi:hypothetical protein C7999DRAFT_44866 [Corynascus novoguineensis]|uniref:Haloacid dehalogenase-like hydrolase n=1 Tax=Corynascus novoguineensis TaxID=1126955 RepID=A0AAN7CLJ7_9PEZI|nr:hypothetical protein C7999DRAFT_44866 [Corynascus novoguineensis]